MIKEKVKALWKLCFEDSEAFIEMYFRLRYNNEVNIAIESGDEVISALQMLPYPMTFCGKQIQTLSQALTKMLHNNVILSTLIPAEPWLFDYYAHMGYAPVFCYSENDIPDQDRSSTGVSVKRLTDEQEEVYQYLNQKMKERPCCIQHTQTDFKVILADLEISRGKMYIAIYEKKISGVAIVYQQENRLRISELFAENKEIEKALLYHIQQDKKNGKVTLLTPPAANGKPFVLGMARIVDAKTFLQIYAASYPNIEMNIELTDKVLTTNNGYYYLCKGKCMFSKERLQGSHSQLTIGELCEKILLPLKPYMSLMLN